MENENKNKKSAGSIALVVVLLIVTIVSIVMATYAWARYTTVETGTATAAVANWEVSFENDQTSFVRTYNYIAPNNIAPGSEGNIVMTITSGDTEVAYDWVLSMTNLANKPTNLHFYSDSAMTSEITFSGTSSQSNSNLNGHVDLNATTHKANTVASQPAIYYRWAYQTTTALTGTQVAALENGSAKVTRAVHDLTAYANQQGYITRNSGEEAANQVANLDTIDGLITLISKYDTTNGASECAKIINDAIDTVDGITLGNSSMSFNIVFKATQTQPTVPTP